MLLPTIQNEKVGRVAKNLAQRYQEYRNRK